jgi:hypothetical protein
MISEEVLSYPPRVLTQAQRESYFEDGYLRMEGLISPDWVARLQVATARMVELSRGQSESNEMFVLDAGHTAATPRLRRLNCAVDYDPAFWEYASQSRIPDMAADLVGPDVKFRESLINFKWARGGDEVRWHQDIPFYPHTNLTPLLILTLLADVEPDQAPLKVVPGSHKLGPLEHYDRDSGWLARVSEEELEKVALDEELEITGPAGTVIALHGCIVHGSGRNHSDRNRPLLTCGYSSADAFCYTPLPSGNISKYIWQIVRGEAAKYAQHDPVRMRIPPDYTRAYTSIFEMQKGQSRPVEGA